MLREVQESISETVFSCSNWRLTEVLINVSCLCIRVQHAMPFRDRSTRYVNATVRGHRRSAHPRYQIPNVRICSSWLEYSVSVVIDVQYSVQLWKKSALASRLKSASYQSSPHNHHGAHQHDKLGCLPYHCRDYSISCR